MRAALSALLLCIVGLSAPAALAQGEDGARFPPHHAENLEGRVYNLPGDFEGDYNVLVIAYRRAQQAEVDTWFAPLEAIETADGRVHFYELPVIARMTGIVMGWMIDRGMRSGIPDADKRARVITIYIDKSRFKAALGLPDGEETIRILLVDRRGRVHWRGDGPYTEAMGESLRARLAALD